MLAGQEKVPCLSSSSRCGRRALQKGIEARDNECPMIKAIPMGAISSVGEGVIIYGTYSLHYKVLELRVLGGWVGYAPVPLAI